MADRKKGRAALAFGEFLRDRRRELKLTQQEVADVAGIHRTLLADYERPDVPERTPTDATLFGLAQALQVDAELMFDYAEVDYPKVDMSVSKSAPPELYDRLDKLEELIVALTERLAGLDAPPASPSGGRPRRPRPS